jgi:spore maturation protein SpmB
LSTIAPVVAILNDPPPTTSPVFAVIPSMLAGVAITLFAVVFVLTCIVKGLFEAVKTVIGPLFKILGVLTVVALLLAAALLSGSGSESPPTQSLTPGSLFAVGK